jgi:two-component system, OmpR family, sensor histidine kinase KdpD
MQETTPRPIPTPSPAQAAHETRSRIRLYTGAAEGVGKTCRMLDDAHELRRQGFDVAIGFVEPHGRADTIARIGDLEQIPLKALEYRGVKVLDMDVDGILARHPQIALVDELAHANAPGAKHQKRYEDVLALVDAGISVITAVNVWHLESLNDVVAQTTGIRVRETIPDWVLKRADEVVNVDVSVETLRWRLRQGKIYEESKIQEKLATVYRKRNLTTLRALALRQLASDQEAKAREYREREGVERPAIPEKVMVAMASRGSARALLRVGSRIAGRLAGDWFAVYVETPSEEPGRIRPEDRAALDDSIRFAQELGAKVVKLTGANVADALVEFATRECITHVIFGQSARTRWELVLHGSIVDRFLRDVRSATVQIVPVARTLEVVSDES